LSGLRSCWRIRSRADAAMSDFANSYLGCLRAIVGPRPLLVPRAPAPWWLDEFEAAHEHQSCIEPWHGFLPMPVSMR
jgi:hypothetical protein